MHIRSLSRFSATLLHLVLSLLIAGVIVALFWGIWYPNGLATVAGATELLFIVVAVDVLIGPLLTFIVFDVNKKGLGRDLLVIALLQFAALGYGVHVMLHTRPIFLVALVDGLLLVSANEIEDDDLRRASAPEYAYKSYLGPVWVSSQDPQDPQRLTELTVSVVQGGPEIERLPEFYGAFEPMARELVKRSERLPAWSESTDPDAQEAFAWVSAQGLNAGTVSVVSIAGRGGISAMLLDTATAKPLRVFNFNPVPPALASSKQGLDP